MNKYFLLGLLSFLPLFSYSQHFYRTTGGEIILSTCDFSSNNRNTSTKLRFSMFFHQNVNYHYNLNNNVGMFTGIGVRNIGFIYSSGDSTFKKRAYTFGIPVAIKVGDLSKDVFLYFGGEVEIPFHFKEKLIVGKNKEKYGAWFDNRTNLLLPSVFIGTQFKSGISFKIKYYLKNFLNRDFNGTDFGEQVNYNSIDSRLIYVSVSFGLKSKSLKKMIKTKEDNTYASLNI